MTEIVTPFHAPSGDAKLVLFADEEIHDGGGAEQEVGKYLSRCAAYAAACKVHLVSGLFVHRDNLCLCLIDPKGRPLCRQPALQLSLPQEGRYATGSEVAVTHTELGNFYLCVDADIYHPQTVRAAALKGADVVLSIQHLDPAEDTPERQMRSIWNAAQSNNLYVVNLSAKGGSVACPAPITRARDGYLVRRTGAFPMRFGLNLTRLDDVRSGFQIMENINTRLVQNYAAELGR